MSLLLAYLIGGQPVGVVVTSWLNSELNGNPPFLVSDSVESGYQDISSIENWNNIQVLDWSRRRDEIKPLLYAITGADLSTYGNLSASQKLIAAKYFLVPYGLRVTNGIVNEQEDKDNWTFLLSETKYSRLACSEAMRKYVGDYVRTGVLSLLQTQAFGEDLVSLGHLLFLFEDYNSPKFKQWLTNEAGSIYELAGFAQKAYYSESLKDNLMLIYNGAY